MMNENAKIGNIAAAFDVKPQTIRNWLALGEEYFSESATRKYSKRFTPSDIQQLQRIQELLSEGLTYNQIPDHLTAAPQIVEPFEDPQPEQHQDQQETNNAIMFLQNQYEQLKILVDVTINAKDETIQTLKDENERLRNDLDRARLPWWKRL